MKIWSFWAETFWEISDEPKRHNPRWKVKVGTKQPGAMAKLDVLLENYATLFPERTTSVINGKTCNRDNYRSSGP